MNQVSIEPYRECLHYIDDYWLRVRREQPKDEGTLIGLPRPYMCANHDMFKGLYYWDSYFIVLGLEHTRHEEFVLHITENVLYLMERFGRVRVPALRSPRKGCLKWPMAALFSSTRSPN